MCHSVKNPQGNEGDYFPPKPCYYRPGPRSNYFTVDCLNDTDDKCMFTGERCSLKPELKTPGTDNPAPEAS